MTKTSTSTSTTAREREALTRRGLAGLVLIGSAPRSAPDPAAVPSPSKPAAVHAPPNPPKPKRTPEQEAAHAARKADEARRHEANVKRRAENAARCSTSNPPDSARASVAAWHKLTPEERLRRGEARDKLHASLDALGDKLPTPAEAIELVGLAAEAFEPKTVAARLTKLLWKLAASGPAPA
ncbi:MAG: hypothetical protein HYZ53_24705 [Planctomycetes bacterium]|nr:hypothetical protein [Planctomycetota bacterium]